MSEERIIVTSWTKDNGYCYVGFHLNDGVTSHYLERKIPEGLPLRHKYLNNIHWDIKFDREEISNASPLIGPARDLWEYLINEHGFEVNRKSPLHETLSS